MMVFPAINCPEAGCVVDKLRRAEKYFPGAEWIHLDIADGQFTFNRTWNDPVFWLNLAPRFRTEVHLMTEEPEKEAAVWLRHGAKRVIAHYETFKDRHLEGRRILNRRIADHLSALARQHDGELMIALNPETTMEEVVPFLGEVRSFQIFAQAQPGPAAQPFLPAALDKIGRLRKLAPQAFIEVDGGIDPKTAAAAKAAGADAVVSGTYLFHGENPAAAYATLRAI